MMAMFLKKTVILLLLLLPEASFQSTIVLIDNCPRQYTIKKPDGDDVTVKLRIKGCSRVDKLRAKGRGNEYSLIEDLVPPHMTPVVIDGKYLAQIELAIAPSLGKYPEKVWLEIVSYNRTQEIDIPLQRKCIRFTISNTTADQYWDPLQLTFSCLMLIDDKHNQLMMSSQIWSLPGSQNSRLCRQTRALGDARTCGVRCSDETVYPLSLAGENEYELCTCADKTQFKSTISVVNEKVVVKLKGLPPLIGTITAQIGSITGETVYTEKIKTAGIRDGKTEFTVTKKLAPGNYSLYFDGDCKFSRDTNYREMDRNMNGIKMVCRYSDDIHAETSFNVLGQEDSRVPFMHVFGVIAGVVLVVFATSLVFIVRYLRNRKAYTSDQPNNESCEMPVMSSSWVDTDDTVEETEITFVEANASFPLVSKSDPETENVQLTSIEDKHPSDEVTMMMYHPDTESHVKNVEQLVKEASRKGVEMVCGNKENWRNFAEGAVDCHKNIVIFLSKGLVQLCEYYKAKEYPAMENEEFKKIIGERGYEYAPCIVMEKTQIRLHECPGRQDFQVHLVTFCNSVENDEELKTRFLHVYDFLKRTKIVQCYFIKPNDTDFEDKLNALTKNISSLTYCE